MGLIAVIGPGLLIAATGVGAGDLATAALAGSRLGLGVAWAVLVGAVMKFVITEGLARWQLATGTTLLEGVASHIGRWAVVIFLAYLLLWSFFVGGALMSACSATLRAIVLPDVESQALRIGVGAGHGLLGLVLVWIGGYKLFSRVMAGAVGLMVVAVVVAAVALRPDVADLLRGLFVPDIDQLRQSPPPTAAEGAGSPLSWVVGLIGGVGGTVTVLCYGYWLRETGRDTREHLSSMRVDLAVGYLVTALFGVCMIVIASGVQAVDGRGAGLLVQLSQRLDDALGTWARLLFLVGAWAAVFSSLLGVWQAVPYLFSDVLRTLTPSRGSSFHQKPLTETRSYRVFLVLLATVPALAMVVRFDQLQLAYAIFGAFFVPLLAVVLLTLNSKAGLVGALRTRLLGIIALVVTLGFFVWVGISGYL